MNNQSQKEYIQFKELVKGIERKLFEKQPDMPKEAFAVINGTVNTSVEYANMGETSSALELIKSVYTYFGSSLN